MVNEHVAVHLGITLCRTHHDDLSRADGIRVPARIVRDWIMNLRYHPHSPHSLMTAFEIPACIE